MEFLKHLWPHKIFELSEDSLKHRFFFMIQIHSDGTIHSMKMFKSITIIIDVDTLNKLNITHSCSREEQMFQFLAPKAMPTFVSIRSQGNIFFSNFDNFIQF